MKISWDQWPIDKYKSNSIRVQFLYFARTFEKQLHYYQIIQLKFEVEVFRIHVVKRNSIIPTYYMLVYRTHHYIYTHIYIAAAICQRHSCANDVKYIFAICLNFIQISNVILIPSIVTMHLWMTFNSEWILLSSCNKEKSERKV